MKELREQKNITRKELSDELNITKRTLSSYETENMRPSQKIAQKILDLLEDKHQSIFRNINVFEWHVKSTIKNEVGQELNTFQSHLQDIIEDIGHISLSHHDIPEFHTFVRPMTLEAKLVAQADFFDSFQTRHRATFEDLDEEWFYSNLDNQFFFKRK